MDYSEIDAISLYTLFYAALLAFLLISSIRHIYLNRAKVASFLPLMNFVFLYIFSTNYFHTFADRLYNCYSMEGRNNLLCSIYPDSSPELNLAAFFFGVPISFFFLVISVLLLIRQNKRSISSICMLFSNIAFLFHTFLVL